MERTTSSILVALFALLSSLNANELIEVSAISDVAGSEFHEIPYVSGEQKATFHVSKTPLIATEDVANVSIGEDLLVVIVKLNEKGSEKMKAGTADMTGKRIAIIVNGRIQVAPVLQTAPLGGQFQISGFKDAAEAEAFFDRFSKEND